ncbi:hypothetical protein H4R35_000691 [Dimargaris xerosporica]|nr:hypothetical protein H4R35_000691 [Dimargaris xerosporica]
MAKSTFKRFAEAGRVVVINYGPDANKMAVIVDIIDHNRALIDGPTTGVPRQELSFRRMVLTGLKVKNLPRNSKSGYLKKLMEEQNINEAWQQTAWSKKIVQRETRANLTDFERFKVAHFQLIRSRQIRNNAAKLLKAQKASA